MVKPTGLPPYYFPKLVAEAILHCAEHPTRDFIVGDVGRILDICQRVSPELMDAILVAIGFSGQRTSEAKSADDPHNVFAPMDGYTQVEGDFDNLTIPSISDWIVKKIIFK